jgi:hypothetical protein
MNRELQEYLAKTVDSEFMLEAISPELPLHMRRYSLYRGRLLGIDLVFATVNQDEQSASEYAQMALLFRRELSLPVVFVFQSLPSAKRNSLIRHGVPFVVPKWQLFLPPNLHLNERAPQTGVVRKSMRPATQAVVIRQLVRGDVEGRTAGEIAKTLGFSKMTLSNVSSELATLGLADFKGWPGVVRFKARGRALWDMAYPYLASPVQCVVPNAVDPTNLPLAGLSALAEYSMIAPDSVPVYACTSKESKMPDICVRSADAGDARSLLQVWRYNPRLCGGEFVDRLSLILSLKSECDPRIQSEIDHMLKENTWQ